MSDIIIDKSRIKLLELIGTGECCIAKKQLVKIIQATITVLIAMIILHNNL